MIIEKGVEMIGLCENLKSILPIIDAVYTRQGIPMVVTATRWGRDPLRLAHKSGHALDVGRPSLHEPATMALLKDTLGLNYTVRFFKTHFHIEYTPLSAFPVNHRQKGAHAESLSPVREARRRGIA